MDDHGQRVLIGTYADRVVAERAMLAFEARGHKQTYWVEPVEPGVALA